MTHPPGERDWLSRANWLALLVPLALVGGALISQYWGGLFPCQMCHWQRWPHYTAIALALLAFPLPPRFRWLVIALAAVAILTSGGLGVFHAGVEYHWWQGPGCAAPNVSFEELMRQPVISCDTPQWTLGPVSLAGFNALFSLAGGLAVLYLLARAWRSRIRSL